VAQNAAAKIAKAIIVFSLVSSTFSAWATREFGGGDLNRRCDGELVRTANYKGGYLHLQIKDKNWFWLLFLIPDNELAQIFRRVLNDSVDEKPPGDILQVTTTSDGDPVFSIDGHKAQFFRTGPFRKWHGQDGALYYQQPDVPIRYRIHFYSVGFRDQVSVSVDFLCHSVEIFTAATGLKIEI